MRILACYKLAPEEQDIIVKSDGSISLDRAEWKIGDYDLVGIEAAVSLAKATEGIAYGLSVGPTQLENSKLKKAALSRGLEELYIVADDLLETLDSFQTSSVLAKSIELIGDVDVVICGEGSADLYAQQVGPQLGELLSWSNVNAASKIDVLDNKLIVERTVESQTEVLEVPTPAVISVSSDFAESRIPSMKDILAAGKKPTNQIALSEIGTVPQATTKIVSVLAPPEAARGKVIIEGDGEEQIAAFIDALNKKL